MVEMRYEIQSTYAPLKITLGYVPVWFEFRENDCRMGGGGDTCG